MLAILIIIADVIGLFAQNIYKFKIDSEVARKCQMQKQHKYYTAAQDDNSNWNNLTLYTTLYE